MRRLVLLRHGRTAWNHEGRAQGHADVSLDDVGRAQASAVASYLSGLGLAAIWSSDLARARQTSEYVERLTGISAKYDDRLREYDVGARQGLTLPELAALFPSHHAAFMAGEKVHPVPGSETTRQVAARISPALRESLDSLRTGEAGLVVTHGAALKVGLMSLLGWPHDRVVDLRDMDNCAFATLEELSPGGQIRLVGYNEKPPSSDFASRSPVG